MLLKSTLASPFPVTVPRHSRRASFLFERALQRVLMLPCEIHDLGHLRFGDLVGVNAADADATPMHMQHYSGRLVTGLAEEPLEDVHDKLHRGVIVVQHENLIQRRLFRLRLGLDDGAGGWALIAALLDVAHLRSNIFPTSPHP